MGGRGRFIWGEYSLEESLMSLHKHSNPKQCKHVEAVAQEAGESAKKLKQGKTHQLSQNTHFCASGDVLLCKFYL